MWRGACRTAGPVTEREPEWCGFSALRIDRAGVGHFYGSVAARPEAVRRFVEIADRDGLTLVEKATCDHYAVLDILDATGDIVADRCLPTEAAWQALNSELRLEVIASE